MRFIAPALMLTLLLQSSGCSEKKSQTLEAEPTTKKPVDMAEAKAGPSAILAQPIKVAEFEELVKKHKGKVVVADLWFRYCGPCVEAMPHLAELQTKHHDKLVIMTFAIDEPGKKRDDAVKFLKKEKYPFATYVIADKESEDDWIKKFDIGPFPTTMVYDRNGTLVKRFEGGEDGPELLKTIHKVVNNEPIEPEKKDAGKKGS